MEWSSNRELGRYAEGKDMAQRWGKEICSGWLKESCFGGGYFEGQVTCEIGLEECAGPSPWRCLAGMLGN